MEDAQNHLPRLLSTDGRSQSLTTQFDDAVQPLSIELLADKREFADEGAPMVTLLASNPRMVTK